MASGLADRFQTLHEIVKAARANLTQGPWDYLIGGTETETTVRALEDPEICDKHVKLRLRRDPGSRIMRPGFR